MARQDQIKAAQQRIADQWDAKTSTKSDSPKLEGTMKMRDLLKFLGLVGTFVLLASILFSGTPDLVDTLRAYLECK